MFTPSVTSFLDHARDLYTPSAFDPPVTPVAAPAPNPDWVSYTGPQNIHSPEYKRFRNSPLFLETHRQWLARVDDCERMARKLCLPQEAERISDALNVFRDRLNDRWGESYVTDNMPLLFGEGKRAMDRICQRLEQEELPEDFRKAQLQEMAALLDKCLSTGPAFIQTAQALDTAPDGLRSAMLRVIQNRGDTVCREVYQVEQRDHETESWRRNMEVHGVNRLRLEYRLPGADRSDIHSLGPKLFFPEHEPHHVAELRRGLQPTEVAEDLADVYWGRLQALLPPHVPGLGSGADLNDVMPDIHAAVARVNKAITPVSMTSLMVADESSGSYRWQTDASCLALELLKALETERLVMPQDRETLLTATSRDGTWQLKSVQGRLFHVVERPSGPSQTFLVPVRLDHVLALDQQLKREPRALPAALVWTVIRGESRERLRHIPEHWLTDRRQVLEWLRRIDRSDWLQWLQATPHLRQDTALTVADALTSRGSSDWLEPLLERPSLGGPRWLQEADAKLLTMAMSATDPRTQRIWLSYLRSAFEHLPPDQVHALLSPRRGFNLVFAAMMEGRGHPVSVAVSLLRAGLTRGIVSVKEVPAQVDCPFQAAMEHGHLEAIQALAPFLIDALQHSWISRRDLVALLGGNRPGEACEGAMVQGQGECLRWYLDFVHTLHRRDLLSVEDGLLDLMTQPRSNGSAVTYDTVLQGQAVTLGVYLEWLLRAARDKLISQDHLLLQLGCEGPHESGLVHLLEDKNTACLNAWCDAVSSATLEDLIERRDVERMLTDRNLAGVPLLHALVRKPLAGPLRNWMHTLTELHHAQALDLSQLTRLLRSGPPARDPDSCLPIMHDLLLNEVHPTPFKAYIQHLTHLNKQRVLPSDVLEALLSSCGDRTPFPAIVSATYRGKPAPVDAFLDVLIKLGRERRLSSAALIRVLDGRVADAGPPRPGSSALLVAIQQKKGAMLTRLINTSLTLYQLGAITAQDWLTLLQPQNPTNSPLTALLRVRDPAALAFIHNTIITANGLQILSWEQAKSLLARLA